MQFFHIKDAEFTHSIIQNEDWKTVLAWLREKAPKAELGMHHIDGQRLYASVEEYETLARHQCRFESHRKYIDVQYCLTGSEWIDWTPFDQLTAEGEYDEDRDLSFYYDATATLSLPMTPGAIAILDPKDGHRPKVRTSGHPGVKKAVVKWQIS